MSGFGGLRWRALSCAPMAGLCWISPQAMHRASIGYARCSYAQMRLWAVTAPANTAIHGGVSSFNSMRFVRSPVLPQSGNHMRVLYRVGKQELSRPSLISRR